MPSSLAQEGKWREKMLQPMGPLEIAIAALDKSILEQQLLRAQLVAQLPLRKEPKKDGFQRFNPRTGKIEIWWPKADGRKKR